jgi:predicted nucleic acid-binding protein
VKVALDTNVLVSAVATRGLCADIFNHILAEHQLVVGVTVLSELQRVLREKMRLDRLVDRFE